jgi:two-component system phosphate regulon sensor histidine kinase PhoR
VFWPVNGDAEEDEPWVAVPLGDRQGAFGLLWVADAADRRTWSPIELSLLHHLVGVAAQALMQGRIITGQQEVLKRLQRLDDAKTSFLQTVNHELRTPLTSMTAYLDLLRDGAGGELPSSALSMLTVIERNAQRLGLLVEDVLTISRMTADPELGWAPVDVAQVVADVVAKLGASASTRGVQLAAPDCATDLVVEGDPERLRQAFWNIVDNAVKFTPAAGRVLVTVARCESAGEAGISVVVADSGGGIADEDLRDVFTSFFRGSNAHAGAVQGSGLGLAIVRSVVDAHGGTIEVSDTEGGGTTIAVQLPVHHGPAA